MSWIVNPRAHTLEVMRPDQARWVIGGTWAAQQSVSAEPFDGSTGT